MFKVHRTFALFNETRLGVSNEWVYRFVYLDAGKANFLWTFFPSISTTRGNLAISDKKAPKITGSSLSVEGTDKVRLFFTNLLIYILKTKKVNVK